MCDGACGICRSVDIGGGVRLALLLHVVVSPTTRMRPCLVVVVVVVTPLACESLEQGSRQYCSAIAWLLSRQEVNGYNDVVVAGCCWPCW